MDQGELSVVRNLTIGLACFQITMGAESLVEFVILLRSTLNTFKEKSLNPARKNKQFLCAGTCPDSLL